MGHLALLLLVVGLEGLMASAGQEGHLPPPQRTAAVLEVVETAGERQARTAQAQALRARQEEIIL